MYARMAPMLAPTLQLVQDWNHVMDIMNSTSTSTASTSRTIAT